MKIGIDAGHGLNTAGKRTPDNEHEWSFNDKVARAFTAEMLTYEGVEVKRFDDATGATDVPLKTRTDGSNAWGANIHISFHHNALNGVWGTHTGVETHVYQTAPKDSVALANLVQPEIAKAYGLFSRGLKYTDLHITRETHCTAILIEGGYMDSTIDIKKLRDNGVLENAGKGIAHAVASYAGLKKKAGSVSTPAPVVKPSQPVQAVVPDKFGTNPTVVMKVRALQPTDIRKAPSHQAGYVRDAQVGEVFDVYQIEGNWHCVGGTNWIDGNNGANLYWIDNPALKQAPAPKPVSSGIPVVGNIKIANLNSFTYIYATPSDTSAKVGEAHLGSVFPIAGSVPNFYEVIFNGKRAYIKTKYAKRV